MLAQQRHELILRSLRAEGPAAVSALAERLGVSQATIRRDLVQLDRAGRLTRSTAGPSRSATPTSRSPRSRPSGWRRRTRSSRGAPS